LDWLRAGVEPKRAPPTAMISLCLRERGITWTGRRGERGGGGARTGAYSQQKPGRNSADHCRRGESGLGADRRPRQALAAPAAPLLILYFNSNNKADCQVKEVVIYSPALRVYE
jgi:hypothetical protein